MAGMAGKVSQVKYMGRGGNVSGRREVASMPRQLAMKAYTKGVRQESRALARAVQMGDVEALDDAEG